MAVMLKNAFMLQFGIVGEDNRKICPKAEKTILCQMTTTPKKVMLNSIVPNYYCVSFLAAFCIVELQ